MTTNQTFDHERLDVSRLSIEYVARSYEASQSLEGLHRHARDQWLRSAQSIPQNITEGNGKRSHKDRARFLDIARGSALECAAIQEVLVTTKGIKVQDDAAMKAMLTRMAMKFDGVAESNAVYQADFDYEREHRRCATEHEHDSPTEVDVGHAVHDKIKVESRLLVPRPGYAADGGSRPYNFRMQTANIPQHSLCKERPTLAGTLYSPARRGRTSGDDH